MNAKDFFKQLTCGAKFSRPAEKLYIKATFICPTIKKEDIKDEPSDVENSDSDTLLQPPKKRVKKSMDKNSLTLLGNISVPDNIPKLKKLMTEEKFKQIEIEKVNQLKNMYHINVSGKDAPSPVETFKQLKTDYSIPAQIVDNLAACGYNLPTPIQMQAIPIMSSGRSLMACAPTGSGKTAAFLLPIIRDLKKPKKKGFRALILCPTRELAKQTQRECLRLVEGIGLKIHILSKLNRAESQYGATSNQQFDILITTPNRICFLLNQNPPVIDLKNVKWVVLDEADKLFEEGKNSFRNQFNHIFGACTNETKKVALFSATYTNAVAKWLRINVKGALTISIGQRNSATDLVEQELLYVGSEAGKLLAFRELLRKGLQPPVLVFVDSKDRAQQLFDELKFDGINVDVIHSDRNQQQRDSVVKSFREGKVWVLICTELIGRGIDFLGVNLVVNYDFPPSTIAYIHRIGRTGRAGRKGKAVTYFTQNDKINLKSIATIVKNSGSKVPEYMLSIKEHSKKAKRKLEKDAVKREDIRKSRSFKSHSKKSQDTCEVKKPSNILLVKKGRNGFIKKSKNTQNKSGKPLAKGMQSVQNKNKVIQCSKTKNANNDGSMYVKD